MDRTAERDWKLLVEQNELFGILSFSRDAVIWPCSIGIVSEEHKDVKNTAEPSRPAWINFRSINSLSIVRT